MKNKKKENAEFFNRNENRVVDDSNIEEILNNLRQRIINGETLNSFKKEIQQIALLVESKESKHKNIALVVE
jgi:hypothetical protein